MGCIILLFLIVIEIIFCIWNIASGVFHIKEKDIANVGIFLAFVLLNISGIIKWSFRYYMIALVFFIQYLLAIIRIYKGTENQENILNQSIEKVIVKSVLYVLALILTIL